MKGKGEIILETKENVFTDTDKRLFYISDDIDNSSIGSLTFNLGGE